MPRPRRRSCLRSTHSRSVSSTQDRPDEQPLRIAFRATLSKTHVVIAPSDFDMVEKLVPHVTCDFVETIMLRWHCQLPIVIGFAPTLTHDNSPPLESKPHGRGSIH